jgi:hypothetical protein
VRCDDYHLGVFEWPAALHTGFFGNNARIGFVRPIEFAGA